jgi:hypothetical protein
MMDLFSYPHTPGHRSVDTSIAAAADIAPKQPRLQAMVLSAVRLAGDRGLTTDECAVMLNISVLSARPRFSELRVLGKIVDSGLRRLNCSGRHAVVWRLP